MVDFNHTPVLQTDTQLDKESCNYFDQASLSPMWAVS